MPSAITRCVLLASLLAFLPAPLAAGSRAERQEEQPKPPPVVDRRAARAGLETFTQTHAGRERTYHLRLPPGHSTERAWPLLLALHGGGGRRW